MNDPPSWSFASFTAPNGSSSSDTTGPPDVSDPHHSRPSAAAAGSTGPVESTSTARGVFPSPFGSTSSSSTNNRLTPSTSSASNPSMSLSRSNGSALLESDADTVTSPTAAVDTSARLSEQAFTTAGGSGSTITSAQKDADDPSTSMENATSPQQGSATTLMTLSRLFAAQALTSPQNSRHPSYNQAAAEMYTRSSGGESASLSGHLYTRGLLNGRHSDITIKAFGQSYKLHRLILDRAPFFATAFSEPWSESSAKEISLDPQEIDPSITQTAFELALKRLYGCNIPEEEEAEAIGIFATGCWLEMQELVDTSIDYMLRQMSVGSLAPVMRLVTSNCYGKAGDKILASAKAMLCRDGWRIPLRYWDGIPGDVIREIVGSDGFFIDGEWDRWVLAKRLLDRRLRGRAVEVGLVEPHSRRRITAPESLHITALRFDPVYRKSIPHTEPQPGDQHQLWLSVYSHPDIEPLLVLLEEGIHYVHLDFEQLQYIRTAKDAFGLPIVSEKAITNALWMSMELRQRVVNAADNAMELGLARSSSDADEGTAAVEATSQADTGPTTVSRGKRRLTDDSAHDSNNNKDADASTWDGNGRPRKFWIPMADCNIVMGGNAEPIITTSSAFQRHATQLSANLQPEDLQWATDFAASTGGGDQRPPSLRRGSSWGGNGSGTEGAASWKYSHFPPFRFSAEFPNPKLLKEKKRVYSRTVFYAGSLWNIYIQKVRTQKSVQLGVYLHRAKEREAEEVIAGTAGLAQGSVDERIGQLEREMLLRSERHGRRAAARHSHSAAAANDPDGDSSAGSGADADTTPYPSTAAGGSSARAQSLRTLLSARQRKSTTTTATSRASAMSSRGQDNGFPSPHDAPTTSASNRNRDSSLDLDDTYPLTDEEDLSSDADELVSATQRFHVPTLPAYVDARPTIRTYFKIYSPSKGGRMLSVYESAPDKFNFSQSWGWKSSTLMLDEGMLGPSPASTAPGDVLSPTSGHPSGSMPSMNSAASMSATMPSAVGTMEIPDSDLPGKRNQTLRFMVVIGNV